MTENPDKELVAILFSVPKAFGKSHTLLIQISFFILFLISLFIGCTNSIDKTNIEKEALLATEKGEWKKAAELSEQWFQINPKNAEANYQAATNHLRLNFPNKSITILNSFKNADKEPKEEVGKREARLAKGYFMTGQYSKVMEVVKDYTYPKMYRGLAREHLKALIQLGKFKELNHQLETYQKSGIFRENGKPTAMDFLFRAICNELVLVNAEIQLEQYVQKYKLWIGQTEKRIKNFRNQAYAAFYHHNFDGAIFFLEKAIQEEKSPRHLIELNMLLGVSFARLGKFEKAKNQIKEINLIENPPPRHDVFGAKFYNQARIEAAIGEKEKAMESLKKALEANAEFWSYKFKEDSLLNSLIGFPLFDELVKPKG